MNVLAYALLTSIIHLYYQCTLLYCIIKQGNPFCSFVSQFLRVCGISSVVLRTTFSDFSIERVSGTGAGRRALGGATEWLRSAYSIPPAYNMRERGGGKEQ